MKSRHSLWTKTKIDFIEKNNFFFLKLQFVNISIPVQLVESYYSVQTLLALLKQKSKSLGLKTAYMER